MLNGLQCINKLIDAEIVIALTDKVVNICAGYSGRNILRISTNITFNNIKTAPGKDFLNISYRKSPLTIESFGCSDKKKEGSPIINISIKIMCGSLNGYVFIYGTVKAIMLINIVKKVFIKNREEELSTLFITLLPSQTTFGIELKLESNKTK